MKSLSTKILRLMGLVSLISMLILISLNLIEFRNIFSKMQQDAKTYVQESEGIIDGEKLNKVISNRNMNSIEYKEIRESMIKWKNDKNVAYVYTLAKRENKAYFIVDGSIAEPDEIGKEYPLEDEMKDAFNGQVSVNKKPTKDDTGIFISAYAPVKDSSGNIIAIVGADKEVSEFVSIRNKILLDLMITAVIIMILSVGISSFFSKKLSDNVNSIKDNLRKMAEGDLTEELEIKSNDEFEVIAEEINRFRVKISEALKIVQESSNKTMEETENLLALSQEMASSSEVVDSTIEGIAKGSNSQAQELSSINKTLYSFGMKIDETVIRVESVYFDADSISASAKEGDNNLKVLDKFVRDINNSFADVRDKIQGLGMRLSEINEITNLINGIADKTNLLALNAAIEAARAGEAGKGFSVVAEEIRKLAEQSKVSSANINNLTQAISMENSMVVKTSDNMNEKLNEQSQVLNDSMDTLRDIIINIERIIPKIKDINQYVNEINNEKVEILQGVEVASSVSEEVSASTEEIATSSKELSASSTQVACAAEELSDKVEKVSEFIDQFKISSN
ncbi:methyl-accepting chemotaxis protein [Clostridium peptidivorans]|uniref:methyl-accepting chemotaxis protein n=1 Tax=Clostridium peptidivorans TaxID=100174 RepID=UPI000BE3F303|nr:methyl-accepting chemotaxis protein [Clostridium peptidivorans]